MNLLRLVLVGWVDKELAATGNISSLWSSAISATLTCEPSYFSFNSRFAFNTCIGMIHTPIRYGGFPCAIPELMTRMPVSQRDFGRPVSCGENPGLVLL